MAGRALDDLIVVEFAQMVSEPMCGKMFADMGAEVIKIEPMGAGDEMRAHPPFPGDITPTMVSDAERENPLRARDIRRRWWAGLRLRGIQCSRSLWSG